MMLAFAEAEIKPISMKKIIVLLVLFLVTGTVANHADAQPPHAKAWGKKGKHNNWQRGGYRYYPSANVYYSPASRRYWYPRNGVWVNASVLPPSVVVYNQPSYIVYRDMDDDIWRDNRVHYRRYYRPVYVECYRPAVVARPGVSVNIQARF